MAIDLTQLREKAKKANIKPAVPVVDTTTPAEIAPGQIDLPELTPEQKYANIPGLGMYDPAVSMEAIQEVRQTTAKPLLQVSKTLPTPQDFAEAQAGSNVPAKFPLPGTNTWVSIGGKTGDVINSTAYAVGYGALRTIEGLTSPENLALLVSMAGAPKAVAALGEGIFKSMMAVGAAIKGYYTVKSVAEGHPYDAISEGTEALAMAYMANPRKTVTRFKEALQKNAPDKLPQQVIDRLSAKVPEEAALTYKLKRTQSGDVTYDTIHMARTILEKRGLENPPWPHIKNKAKQISDYVNGVRQNLAPDRLAEIQAEVALANDALLTAKIHGASAADGWAGRLTKAQERAETKLAQQLRTPTGSKDIKRTIIELKTAAERKNIDADGLQAIINKKFGKGKDLSNLTQTQLDQIMSYVAQVPSHTDFTIVQELRNSPNVSRKSIDRLEAAIKRYDVTEPELLEMMDLWMTEVPLGTSPINSKLVNTMAQAIRWTFELRPEGSKLTFPWLVPVKRILGERVVGPYRTATTKFLKSYHDILPELDFLKTLDKKSREAITLYREGKLPINNLSREELQASQRLTKFYDRMWDILELDKVVTEAGGLNKLPNYSPRREAFNQKADLVDWMFSRQRMSDFDFWAKHNRTGELHPRENDALVLARDYMRVGLQEKFYKGAAEEVAPFVQQLSTERKQWYDKWVNHVIKKQPTADEIVMNRAIKRVLNKAGIKDVEGRIYKQITAELMNLNYEAFMGFRPKLAIRNLTQQWLIANEYGYGAYVAGLYGKWTPRVRNAIRNSDFLGYRRRQYSTFADRVANLASASDKIRNISMAAYRASDWSNVTTAFATGYMKALRKNPRMPENLLIRAGEKAVTNTQWGYGIDLPYLFASPIGKLVGKYKSWPLWYFDHLGRIVTEKHGAKAGRTVIQGAVLGTMYYGYGIDYLRNWFLGPAAGITSVPPEIKTAWDLFNLITNTGAQNWDDANRYLEATKNDILNYVPGRLLYHDYNTAMEKGLQELFIYTTDDAAKPVDYGREIDRSRSTQRESSRTIKR